MSASSSAPTNADAAAAATEHASMLELQETVSRLSGHTGVEAVLILNAGGDILVQSGAAANTLQAVAVQQLMRTATAYLQSLQPTDRVSFMQIRSQQQQEIMIAPHGDYVLAILKR